MSRMLLLYNLLAYQDVARLWQTVRHHVVIVAGICLPILLLLGLKNGHVAKLREDLVRSPSGRQILLVSGMKGELLTLDALDRLVQETDGAEIGIPDVNRTVSLSVGDGDGTRSIESVTLYATRKGDPIFGDVNPSWSKGGRDLALMESVAERLGAKIGDKVRLTAFRRQDGVDESATVEFRLSATLKSSDGEEQDTGYVLVADIIDLERYSGGYAVPRFEWPAMDVPAPDVYDSYLIFCESSDPLTQDDLSTYAERGYQITAVDDEDLRTLYGLLKRESLDRLLVYRLSTGLGGRARLSLAPGDIARNTDADDVVIPWYDPMTVEADGQPTRLIGLSLPKRTWLRLYADPKEVGMDFDADTFSIQRIGPASESSARLRSRNGLEFDVSVSTIPPAASVVPEPVQAAPEVESASESRAESGLESDEAESASETAPSAEAPESPDAPSAPEGQPSEPAVGEPDPSEADPPEATTSEPNPSEPDSTRSSTSERMQSDGDEIPPLPSEAPVAPEEVAASETIAHETKSVETSSNQTAPEDPRKASIVVGPAYLLAYLHGEERGDLEYDPVRRIFRPKPKEPVFSKVRLYAETIDDVPGVTAQLRERDFSCLSEIGLIEEIQRQDRSLQILVAVVAIGVFLFGVVTVVSVLSDSTDRKRGSIGILRVMGVSRFGIFYMVFARAAAIGVMAAAVTMAFGFAVAFALAWEPESPAWLARWKPVVAIEFRPEDAALIVAGSLLCCVLGSILPARRASRMEPFEAIVEGRFR